MTLARDFIEWLFSAPEGERSLSEIILWWEKRRIPYNLIVGGVGLCSLLLFFLFIQISGELKPGEDAVEPLALLFAPILMNVCYTAGWIVEATLGRVWEQDGVSLAPRMLKYGIGISLGVVLIPSLTWGVHLLMRSLGVS